MIFVFGSNEAGRHGKGAALEARLHWDAIYGQGEGIQGSSYGIPTKDVFLRTLPIDAIRVHVDRFLLFAYDHPEDEFMLTPIGTGLAGYSHEQIAPMFTDAPSNVIFPKEWDRYRSS
jgi:hypothetical protein